MSIFGRFWAKGGLQKGDQILISRPLGTGVIFSAFMNGYVRPYFLDCVLKEMNNSQHEIVNYINQLKYKNPLQNKVNACTDITGFGLLGHLSEMLESTNNQRMKTNSDPVKIIIQLNNIPIYKGLKELLDNGFESTLAPSNKYFLRNIDGDKNLRIELIYDGFESSKLSYNSMLKVLVDPQTCGPLVISCSQAFSDELIKKGPWKKIGFVS